MKPADTLYTLKQRQEYIEATVGRVTSQYATLTDERKNSWPVQQAMKKLELLKLEYKDNEKKIISLEIQGTDVAKAVRPVGRPKAIKGDNFLLPTNNDNRETYIASMEASIDSDLAAIEKAKTQLAAFILEKESKIEYKRKLIEQTKGKLGCGFKADEL